MANEILYGITVQITHGSKTRRLWSGSDDLNFQGHVWEGTQKPNPTTFEMQQTIGVEARELTANELVGDRGRLQISVNDETVRNFYSMNLGQVRITTQWIDSRDNGRTWVVRNFDSGFYSSPNIDPNNILSCDIEGIFGDADRGEVIYWSHSFQQGRHPGDLCCENAQSLAVDGADFTWD